MRPKKAIILAAGRGSRMLDMTADRPKALVEVEGVPLVEWQTSALRASGIVEIVAVTGYRGEQLRPYVDRTHENPDWQDTNMVYSLLCAGGELDEPVVVSYSDIVYSPDAVRGLLSHDDETLVAFDRDWLALWSRRFAEPLSDAETFRIDASGAVTEIGQRATTTAEIQGQYLGLMRFSPRTIRAILEHTTRDERRSMDMTSLLARLIGRGLRVRGVPISGAWCEVDSASDLEVAHQLVAEGALTIPEKRDGPEEST